MAELAVDRVVGKVVGTRPVLGAGWPAAIAAATATVAAAG